MGCGSSNETEVVRLEEEVRTTKQQLEALRQEYDELARQRQTDLQDLEARNAHFSKEMMDMQQALADKDEVLNGSQLKEAFAKAEALNETATSLDLDSRQYQQVSGTVSELKSENNILQVILS